ncbi:tonB-system energizer ExbB [Phytopseudomonas dryadis]|uniref:Biopolymer transport protein ExbB n=1 Tax=Phytopseudomonas dryadis TaxID=2487520 RepID=A0A4Q9R1E6_9GAMM|nr:MULTISPECIES: tonB-system energizer ExbB [Pseudomonas]TBU92600.1 tonB-system energizer ExbB [Pseudomonas dryadis]TBU99660.1 tonB-system energizer ExbB [Pseudomonas dryadis]TBV17736.1 tonB-system energizer ExbB [Pseudomonas sp. FRB 230]
MNSTAHSAKPTTAAARPRRLGALFALLLGLFLVPAASYADESVNTPEPAASAPQAPAADGQDAPAQATAPTAAGEAPADVPAETTAQVNALSEKLEALGPQATPEQINEARQQFISENNIAPQDAEQLLQALDAQQSADAAAMGNDAAAEAEQVFHDLSPWGMYQGADVVVKSVMIGLVLASILTWTVWIAKSIELITARRRLRRELVELKGARNLAQATEQARAKHSFSEILIEDAREELKLSASSREKEGIKERVSFRLERLVAACGRDMSKGTGVLATIGSTAPFVGLFGTVWGIMNSFIGIAKTQTTNLAVVAPGIAEALLATALGLVAAIPAVIIYNVFARSIAAYKAQVADASAQVLLLVSRDLDTLPPGERSQQPHMVKAV